MYEWDDTKPVLIKMHSNITNEIIIMGVLFSGAWSNFIREKKKKKEKLI